MAGDSQQEAMVVRPVRLGRLGRLGAVTRVPAGGHRPAILRGVSPLRGQIGGVCRDLRAQSFRLWKAAKRAIFRASERLVDPERSREDGYLFEANDA
jgi:hypothetical protein